MRQLHNYDYACPSPRPTLQQYRILYTILEYYPLLDSSNLSMEDWARMAKDIEKYYSLFQGFVILHGTDTMAYTASALSFMLQNLGKPVVMTGSQVTHTHTHTHTHRYAQSYADTVTMSSYLPKDSTHSTL